jgi:hypothetical protein
MKKCLPSLAIKEMQIKTTLKIPSHPCSNGYLQESHHQQILARMWGKRNPHTLLVGMYASTTTTENIMDAP